MLATELRLALMSLLDHRLRTALLGGAAAAVTAMFVLLSALSTGITHTLVETATTLSTGHVNIGGYYKAIPTSAEPILPNASKVAAIARRALPELDFLVERGRGWGKLIAEQGSMQAALVGIDIASEPAFGAVVKLVDGDLGSLAQPNTLLLFEQQAKALDLRVGDAVTISAQTGRGVANTLDCRVVAIARDIGLLSVLNVFIPSQSLRELYQIKANVTGVLQFHLRPSALGHVDSIAARLRRVLERSGYRVLEPDSRAFLFKLGSLTREDWTGQQLDVTTWEDEVSFIMWTFTALRGLSSSLLIVLVCIMMAGITNALWIAVRERTREIGTLRAIGMQRGRVVRLFLLEAALLGLLASLLGTACGSLIVTLINRVAFHVPSALQLFLMRDTLFLALDPKILASAIASMTCATSAAALWPALRAANRRPVDAIGHFD